MLCGKYRKKSDENFLQSASIEQKYGKATIRIFFRFLFGMLFVFTSTK